MTAATIPFWAGSSTHAVVQRAQNGVGTGVGR